jgi:hypothetical protein
MASRYWVGGTAAWDGTAGTKWALTSGGAGGQAVPTSADNVFFDAASGANTVTISTGNTGALSINCTGFTGTLAGTAAISISGSVTLATGMTVTYTGTLSFIATATFISAGKTIPSSITVNGSGITFTLGDALSFSGSGLITLTQGTFTTNNFSVLVPAGFLSLTTNIRTLNLGSSTLTVSSDFLLTGTNLTVNAGTSTIVFTSTAGFIGGGKAWNNVSFNGNQTNNIITGANTINTWTISSPTGNGITTVRIDDNQTITTMVCAGASANNRIFLFASPLGTAKTLTATTWTTVSDVDFRDITLTNAKSGTRLGDCGGNTNITFPAAKTVYWNLAGTQAWSATAWATTSNGTPAVNNFPLAQDTATFTDAGNAGTVQLFSPYNIGSIDMSGRTSAMTILVSTNARIYGNWSNGSGTTITGTNRVSFQGRSTQVITSNGKTFTCGIFIETAGGTVQLADALATSYSGTDIDLYSGTLDLNGFTFTITSTAIGFNAGSGTATRNITFNGGTLLIAGTAFTYTSTNFSTTAGTGGGTINLTRATAKTFDGTGGTFNCTLNQGGAGTLTITGANTFSNITNTYGATGATSILFTAGTTNTFTNWNASGTAAKLLTIGSVTAASHTLSKSTGIVNADFLSVSRSTATGGAVWYAGANSTNGGNNTGWIFTAAPLSGNFLMMFR